MYTKLTFGTLLVLLVVVISVSYFLNKEGFENITNEATVQGVKPVDNLSKAVTTVTPASDSSIPERNDIIPEVKISGSGYDAMNLQQKMDLLRDIQQAVRNEILAGRSTKPIISGETRQQPRHTDSTAQGKEYEDNCYKDTEYRCPKNPDGTCPPVPDMTQYIRKDAIPCWGCSLDY